MTSPLQPLHPDDSLIPGKLQNLDCLSTAEIVASLAPDQEGCLKARPDGTVLDGHHRLKILRNRGYDVDVLPRTIVPKIVLDDLEPRDKS